MKLVKVKAKFGSSPFILQTISNLAILGIAILVIRFMQDLANNPECKSIDPITRTGLTGYAWLLAFFTALTILVNLYIILFI